MKKYEIMFIIPSKYTEEEVDEITKKINLLLEEAGAKLGETHNLGKRRLTYPIEGQRNGTYLLTYFESETSGIAKMDLTVRLSGDTLRHIIVERDSHITQLPSLADSEERDPNGGRGDKFSVEEDSGHNDRNAAKQAKPESIDIQELDKKLDEILTEEIL